MFVATGSLKPEERNTFNSHLYSHRKQIKNARRCIGGGVAAAAVTTDTSSSEIQEE